MLAENSNNAPTPSIPCTLNPLHPSRWWRDCGRWRPRQCAMLRAPTASAAPPRYLSTYLSIYLFICICICLSIYIYIHMNLDVYIYIYRYVDIYLSTDASRAHRERRAAAVSIYLSICLSFYPSLYLPIYLSMYVCIYLSIYLSAATLNPPRSPTLHPKPQPESLHLVSSKSFRSRRSFISSPFWTP